MQKVSRRRLAEFVAERTANGSFDRNSVRSLAAYLVDNHRTDQVELLLDDVAAIMASRHGVLLAEVVSAYPLEESVRTAITDYIKKAEKVERVELQESIDPDLIGGLIIRTPTAEFDSSIRTQLRHLKSIKETRS